MATSLSRRAIVGAAVSGSAVALTAGRVLAQAAGDHAGHGGATMAGKSGKHAALIRAAADCMGTAEICQAHCLRLLGSGDTSLKDCSGLVAATIAMCGALTRLAALDSPRLIALAKVCVDECAACEKECRKHEGHHAECKACADACAACIKACKALGV